jgi:hypothetical protein
MKFSEWSKNETALVRIRKDLRNYLKRVAKTNGVSMFYLTNQAVLEKYMHYKNKSVLEVK